MRRHLPLGIRVVMLRRSNSQVVVRRHRRAAPPLLFGAHNDLQWPGRSVGSVVIASEPRSGSTLLADALADTGEFGIPHEYLIYPEIGKATREFGLPRPTLSQRFRIPVRRALGRPDWWAVFDFRREDLPHFLNELVRRRTSSNGVFALKIHWRTYSMMSERFGFEFDMLPQPIQWVHLERDDVVAQAVSFVKAQQTGVFGLRGSAEELSSAQPSYDDEVLVGAFLKMVAGRDGWRAFFSERGIDAVGVGYEELLDDYSGTVRRVADSLGRPLARVPEPRLRRQADALNQQWADRFRANHAMLIQKALGQ